jgi:hypothetical protein
MTKKFLFIATALAMVAVLAMPLSALAAPQSGNTQVTGVLSATYTLSVPSNFSFDSFTTAGASKTGLTLTASNAGGSENRVTITAVDSSGNSGHLHGTAGNLSTVLQLSGTSVSTVNLSGTSQILVSDQLLTANQWTTSELTIAQPAFNQVAAGSYTTTITFEATFAGP